MVICPACGRTSHDAEFCDHCNADLMPPAARPAPTLCPLNPEGPLYLTRPQAAALTRPEASATVQGPDGGWRLRWLPQPTWERRRHAFEGRCRYRTEVLSPCRTVPDQDGVWVVAEAVPPRPAPWLAAPALDPHEELRRLEDCLDVLSDALQTLHGLGLLCLTFDPREIEFVPGSPGPPRVRFANLDLEVYPAGRCPEYLHANPKFAPPEVCRFRAADFGPATDVFHLAAFAYYWLARLLPGGFLGGGLEAFGHMLPPLRVYAPRLPPGIAPVLGRGLALDPARRMPTPAAFLEEFRAARERAERRAASTVPVRWELGVHTRAGGAKTLLQRVNEDCALVRRFDSPPRALLAVADGISTCDVGSGDLASRTTCDLLEQAFGPQTTQDLFTQKIPRVCREASASLLDWAVRQGAKERLADGEDLMGTTLTAGWLEGNRLVLANLGDSRAYLIDGRGAEQLTVDGDLANTLLAGRVPPEDVREIGVTAKALRDCVGGCSRSPDGEPAVQEQHCTPTVTTWRLLPGDWVILCTDGLVEEGVFLHPADLVDLLRRHASLPAQALAVKLADAADALQRMPSAAEPQGFGDNISCIVIKVSSQ
jgi:serine/threonine protein phosphatase PrpC